MLGIAEIIKKPVLIGLVLFIAVCAGSVSAQKKAKPDFTGTWVLDEDKTFDLLKKLSKKSAPSPEAALKRTTTLIIHHTDPRFEFSEKHVIEKFDDAGKITGKTESILPTTILFTDKRKEVNIYQDNRPLSSVTAWDGKRIQTVITLDKDRRQLRTVTFSLSRDGNELQIKYMEMNPAGMDLGGWSSGVRVYKKVNQ